MFSGTLLGTMTSIAHVPPRKFLCNIQNSMTRHAFAKVSRRHIAIEQRAQHTLPCLDRMSNRTRGCREVTLSLRGSRFRLPGASFRRSSAATVCAEPPGLFLAPSLSLPENHHVSNALILFQDCWRLARNTQTWLTDSTSDEFTSGVLKSRCKVQRSLIVLVLRCAFREYCGVPGRLG